MVNYPTDPTVAQRRAMADHARRTNQCLGVVYRSVCFDARKPGQPFVPWRGGFLTWSPAGVMAWTAEIGEPWRQWKPKKKITKMTGPRTERARRKRSMEIGN